MKLQEVINQREHVLSTNEEEILDYILKNLSTSKNLSCEELAKACFVSRTTLLRFCRKLGLNGFAELKYLLKTAEDPSLQSEFDIEMACLNYHHIIDNLREENYHEICKLIYESETIYIYGTGNAQKSEAEEFKRIFLSAGKCVIDLFDLGEIEFAKTSFTKKDLFVIISLSGETPSGIEILKAVLPTKIIPLSITRFDNNSIARICAYNLYVGTKTLQGSQNFSYEQTAAFYVLFDILFVNYLRYTKEKLYEN